MAARGMSHLVCVRFKDGSVKRIPWAEAEKLRTQNRLAKENNGFISKTQYKLSIAEVPEKVASRINSDSDAKELIKKTTIKRKKAAKKRRERITRQSKNKQERANNDQV